LESSGLETPASLCAERPVCEGCGRERFGRLNRFNKGILQLYGAAVNINSVEFRRFTVLNMRTRTAEQDATNRLGCDKKPRNFWEAPNGLSMGRTKADSALPLLNHTGFSLLWTVTKMSH